MNTNKPHVVDSEVDDESKYFPVDDEEMRILRREKQLEKKRILPRDIQEVSDLCEEEALDIDLSDSEQHPPRPDLDWDDEREADVNGNLEGFVINDGEIEYDTDYELEKIQQQRESEVNELAFLEKKKASLKQKLKAIKIKIAKLKQRLQKRKPNCFKPRQTTVMIQLKKRNKLR